MLIDCHIHCALSGLGKLQKGEIMDSNIRRRWFEALIKRYKHFGVIALRDGGDPFGSGAEFKKLARDAEIIFKTPLVALYKKGLYGDFLGQAIEDNADCKKTMDALLKRQPDFIKIIQSGIMSFEEYGVAGPLEFTKEELTYLINRAHDAGLNTMVHINTPKGIEMAIEAGADSIEHGYCIDNDCIQGLKENGVVWVPTLSPFANIASCKHNHPFAKYREVSRRYFTEHYKQVEKAHQMGVTIALGSDAGAPLVPHGQAAKDELDYLLECGMTEAEIFRNSSRVLDIRP